MGKINVLGNDPGSVNKAICDITLDGMTYTENFEEEIPVVTIHNWEVWNLKTLVGIRRKEGTSHYEKYQLGRREQSTNPLDDSEKDNIATWLVGMNHFIFHNEWLFEKRVTGEEGGEKNELSILAIENQFDHIKSFGTRTDMHTISNAFASSINMRDLEKSYTEKSHGEESARLIIKRAIKYGVPHNGSVGDHDKRKEEAIKVTFKLLETLGYHEWLGFLETAKKSGQKIDDLCDAFLLALQTAVDIHILQNKNKLPANIPRTPILPILKRPLEVAFPEIEVHDMPQKKQRKTPAPRKKSGGVNNNKKKTVATSEIDNEESIKRRRLNMTFREIDDEVDEVVTTKLKPVTKKKRPTVKGVNNKKANLVPLSIEILDDDTISC